MSSEALGIDYKWLITTLLVLIGLISELVYRYILPYKRRKVEERNKEKERLELKKKDLSSTIRYCDTYKRAIDHHIENGVKNYRFELTGELSGGYSRAPTPKVQDAIKIYYEKVTECNILRMIMVRICKLVIIETIRLHCTDLDSRSSLVIIF